LLRMSMAEDNRRRAALREANQSLAESLDGRGEKLFGRAAIERYIDDPEEGHYVQSPKSFLGADIDTQYIEVFTRVAFHMIRHLKTKAEERTGRELTRAVLGRPVFFHGGRGEEGNRQAVGILEEAARRAGFRHVEFLEEPIAAAMHYERSLQEERRVLIVDIGGGTTDCSMLLLGPERREKTDRREDVIGLAGRRVGGLDLDRALSLTQVMPHFGKGEQYRNGEIPNALFFDAVSIDDVNARRRFYSRQARDRIHAFWKLSEEEVQEKIERFRILQESNGIFRLQRSVEEAKITLSTRMETRIDLNYIDEGFSIPVDREQLHSAISRDLEKILSTVEEAIRQADTLPETIYLTGGTSQSPLIRQAIADRYGGIELVSGDNLASVGLGLSEWAGKIFR